MQIIRQFFAEFFANVNFIVKFYVFFSEKAQHNFIKMSAFERERSAHKALDLLLTAQSAFERERSAHNAIDLLLTAQRAF